jgi:hypothetical protein
MLCDVGKAPDSRRNRCSAKVVGFVPLAALSIRNKLPERHALLDYLVGAGGWL